LNEYVSEIISDFDNLSTLTSLNEIALKIVEDSKSETFESDLSEDVNGTLISENDGTIDDSIQSVRGDTIDDSFSIFTETHESHECLFIFPENRFSDYENFTSNQRILLSSEEEENYFQSNIFTSLGESFM
jgi:hypothetical protein